MLKDPVLVIMAAGMGSRFGGLKQMEPIGPNGEWILEYSLYDAWRAGFQEAVIIIKEENENLMKELIDTRVKGKIKISYAYQKLEDIPSDQILPSQRTKPWGTGQAVLAAKNMINGPFAAINADDYYGREAFELIYNHLKDSSEKGDTSFAMVGYLIKNTLTDNGFVSRGVCQVDEDGSLKNIVERVHIIQTVDGPMYTEDQQVYHRLPDETVVSMNMWGFSRDMLAALENSFRVFFKKEVPKNPLKSEFFLPFAVEEMLEGNHASVRVFTTKDKWYGITYKEDAPTVKTALEQLHNSQFYPRCLWA